MKMPEDLKIDPLLQPVHDTMMPMFLMAEVPDSVYEKWFAFLREIQDWRSKKNGDKVA